MKYVYAIIPSGERITFGPIGLGGRGDHVYSQPHAEVAAVLSECPALDFRRMTKEKLVLYLAAHQQLTETIMQRYPTVLPVKFGTLLEGEEEVESVLHSGYGGLRGALQAMEGKVELEVVATWDMGQVFAEIGEEDDVAALRAEIASKPAQQTFPQRLKLGQMVKASLDRRKEGHCDTMLAFLAGHAADVQVNIAPSDSVVMNVAFLIEADRQDDFCRKVHELDARFDSRLSFKVVGPLPPYSFSTVEVKKINAEEVDRARKSLSLGREGTMREIQAAYRRQARRYHPDRAPDDARAEERFREVTAAYGVLASCCQAQGNDVCSFHAAAVAQAPLVTVRRSEELVT